jgi:glycosyltransferase involved in cell wall biosynthesis
MYGQADAFVLPSYFEGYGMVLAEALAHGLPVISTTAGAIPDTVPREAGVLVPPGDAAALRAALAALLDEPALRTRLAAGARAARAVLPTWPQAVARFAAALDFLDIEHESGAPA